MTYMSYFRPRSLRKVCALVAATLTLPALAYAGHDKGNGNDGENNDKENNDKGNDRGDKHIPIVPEANAGWVLIPFFGAVLLVSARQLFRGKVAE